MKEWAIFRMLYLSIGIYFLVLAYYYDFASRKYQGQNFHINICLLILILLAGLRYRMAPDSVAYMSNFNLDMVPLSELQMSTFDSKYQPLWLLLNSFCKSFGNYLLFQMLCAAILNYSVVSFFRNSTDKVFTCLVFYYFLCYFYFSMEILRESLAVAMFLFAVIKFDRRKYFQCTLFYLAAFLFHTFAAVLIVTPIVMSNRISMTWKLATFGVAAIGFIALGDSVYLLASNIQSFDVSFYDIDGAMTLQGYIYNFLRITPVLLLIYIFRSRPIPGLALNQNLVFSLCLVYCCVVLIRITTIPFMDRIANYFILFPILALSSGIFEIARKFVIKPLRYPFVLSASIVSLMFYIMPLFKPDSVYDVPNYKRYYPYASVLTEELDSDREYIIRAEAKE